MAHSSYEMMISLALDGLLSSEEEQDLHQHLETCSFCADTWTRMCQLDTMFKRPIEVTPPVNFTARVMARVEAYETRRHWQPWLVGVLVVASIIAALTVAAPVAFFALGLQHTITEWPLVGTVVGFVLSSLATLQEGVRLAASALADWLSLLASDPAVLAVVVSALVLASTWIGLLEVTKVMRSANAQQSA